MTNPRHVDPFDALDDDDFDEQVSKLFAKPARSANVSLRMPALLLERLKRAAGRSGLPYQTFAKRLLEIGLDRLESTDGLRRRAPQDMSEARAWMETQKQRLVAWSADALADRLRGRVIHGAIADPVEALLEYRRDGLRRRVGILVHDKADEVTYGPSGGFAIGLKSLGCDEGYVIWFTAPSKGREREAAQYGIHYEGIPRLLEAVHGSRQMAL